MLRFLLALALAGTAYYLFRTPSRKSVWTLVVILILGLTVDGAWLPHIAAGLSSQPHAADIPKDTATLSEVAAMFTLRSPQLVSPSHAEFVAGESGRSTLENNAQSRTAAA